MTRMQHTIEAIISTPECRIDSPKSQHDINYNDYISFAQKGELLLILHERAVGVPYAEVKPNDQCGQCPGKKMLEVWMAIANYVTVQLLERPLCFLEEMGKPEWVLQPVETRSGTYD